MKKLLYLCVLLAFCSCERTRINQANRQACRSPYLLAEIGDNLFVKAPNIFTPNGDNVNDIWVPKSFSDVVLREVKIYDRWGRLMQISTTDFPNLWDGRHYRTGAQAPAGVYYYYVSFDVRRLSGDETLELKGWVTLLL